MRHWGNYLVEVGYWIAVAFLWAGAGAIFALIGGLLKGEALAGLAARLWGIGLLYAFAATYLLVGLYLILLIIKLHGQRGWFVREGPGGLIRISAGAIRDLVRQTLRDEVGLPRFQVRLAHVAGGVRVEVVAGLAPGQEVAATGERVQQLLRQRIEEQIGVPVAEVAFLTRSILGRAEVRGREKGGGE